MEPTSGTTGIQCFRLVSKYLSTGVASPWHVWTQWHTGDLGTYNYGVPIEFDLNKNILSLRVLSHYYDSISCFNTTPPNCGYRWSEPLKQGIWYDVLLHVKWSTRSDGLVEGRIKLINGSTSVVHQILTYHGNTLNNLTTAPADDKMVYLKEGLYRNPNINTNQVIYHDGMVIAECPTNTIFNPDTEKCNP